MSGIILSLSLMAQMPASGAEVSLSVEFDDEPLADVLETLSSISETEIELAGDVADQRVSTVLANATLKKGLTQVLDNINHTLIWRSDGGITVLVLGTGEPVLISTPVAEPANVISQEMPSATIALDGSKRISSKSYANNPDAELLPPESPGQRGLTLVEYEAQKAQRQQIPSSKYEILPPDEPGGAGLTLAEFEQQRHNKAERQTSAETVLPD